MTIARRPTGRQADAPGRVDVAGTGLVVLDRVYLPSGRLLSERLGGSCGNVLLSLAMLGWRVSPLIAIGSDGVGDRLVREFAEAGADTRHVSRRVGRSTPIIAQHLDPCAGAHRFSFECPVTGRALPRFEPIEREDVAGADDVLGTASVFYADRLSETIVEAMQAARAAGAIVLFEPSKIGDVELFRRAARAADVLKFSAERLGALDAGETADGPARVVTHGGAGLELLSRDERLWCPAIPAPRVRDTSGAGDMVSVGLIHAMLSREGRLDVRSLRDLAEGVRSGQRLAAQNCAFAGARGVFHAKGPDFVRSVVTPR